MSVGSALKLSCIGFAGGVILRLIDMLYFYNYTTGFYANNGIFSWVGLAFAAIISIVSAIMCYRDKRSFFGPFTPRKNYFTGTIALLSAVALITMGTVQIYQHINHIDLNLVGRNYSQSSVMHLIFIGVSFVFAALLMFSAFNFYRGKNLFTKVRLLNLISVLWGISNLLFTFFYYGKSTSKVENIYTVVGNALLLLALLYLSKLLSGIGGEKSAKRLYMFGIPAVVLTITYTVSNFAISLLQRTYLDFGEIPLPVQLANMAVAFYILAFLFTFKRYSLKRKSRMAPEERETAERKKAPRYRKPQ